MSFSRPLHPSLHVFITLELFPSLQLSTSTATSRHFLKTNCIKSCVFQRWRDGSTAEPGQHRGADVESRAARRGSRYRRLGLVPRQPAVQADQLSAHQHLLAHRKRPTSYTVSISVTCASILCVHQYLYLHALGTRVTLHIHALGKRVTLHIHALGTRVTLHIHAVSTPALALQRCKHTSTCASTLEHGIILQVTHPHRYISIKL